MKVNVVAIEDFSLSEPYDKRYVIVDKGTGEVLDDAQGYGYKSVQKAYAAWNYKNRDKSKDKENAASCQETSSSLHEISEAMNHIEENAEKTKEMAAELGSTIRYFHA